MDVVILERAKSAFLPTNVPGCVLWLAADRITGLADAAAVASWSDLSGNGFDAAQATGSKQPLYKVNLIAGKPAVRFDGTDDFLGFSGAALGMAQNVAGFTVAVVCQTTAPGTDKRMFSLSTNGSSNARFSVVRENGAAGQYSIATRRLDADSVTTHSVNSQLTAGEWAIQTAWRDYTNQLDAIYKNGSQVGGFAAGTSGNSENTASTTGAVGSASNGAGNFTNGDIAEVIAYARALNAGELNRLHAYLGRKYGLAIS